MYTYTYVTYVNCFLISILISVLIITGKKAWILTGMWIVFLGVFLWSYRQIGPIIIIGNYLHLKLHFFRVWYDFSYQTRYTWTFFHLLKTEKAPFYVQDFKITPRKAQFQNSKFSNIFQFFFSNLKPGTIPRWKTRQEKMSCNGHAKHLI